MLQAIRKATLPSRLFVAGSCEMFGNSHQQPVTCESRCDPVNPYALQKSQLFGPFETIVNEMAYLHVQVFYLITKVLYDQNTL